MTDESNTTPTESTNTTPSTHTTTVYIEEPTVGDAFSAWLESTGDLFSATVGSVKKVLNKNDAIVAHRYSVDLIMFAAKVDRDKAEHIYRDYLQYQKQKTPKDIINNSLSNNE
jgi:hypothetical protein